MATLRNTSLIQPANPVRNGYKAGKKKKYIICNKIKIKLQNNQI